MMSYPRPSNRLLTLSLKPITSLTKTPPVHGMIFFLSEETSSSSLDSIPILDRRNSYDYEYSESEVKTGQFNP